MTESFTRRKHGHDYRAPWKYHITIGKAEGCMDFSSLQIESLTPFGVKVKWTEIGETIVEAIRSIHLIEPKIQVYQYIVMPDHLHLLLRVRARMEKPLGAAIHSLKSAVTSKVRALLQSPELQVFTPDYNDRIIFAHRDLNTVYEYIRQNPYRLAVRRQMPAFFSKSRAVTVAGRVCQVYGNLFHLRNPFKTALVVHRADSQAEIDAKLEACLYAARNGGVVVSAFISPKEKAIREQIEQAGGRLIVIHERTFGERDKPWGRDFALCAEGRLLLLSPLDYEARPKSERISRQKCLEMNALAEQLAAGAEIR